MHHFIFVFSENIQSIIIITIIMMMIIIITTKIIIITIKIIILKQDSRYSDQEQYVICPIFLGLLIRWSKDY